MSKNKESLSKIKISTLEAVGLPIANNLVKVESLIKGHYSEEYMFSGPHLTALMELNVSCRVLVSTIFDLIEQAREENVSFVYLPPSEINIISTLAHSLFKSFELNIGNVSLLEN